jgi:hypothetical protein
MQCRQDTPFPGDVTVRDRLLDRQAFEFDTKPDDFGEIISRDRGDPVATLVDQGDQAVIFQTAEGFAQRTETDAERGTQPVQIELASGSNSPRMIASAGARRAPWRVADAGTARVRASLMVLRLPARAIKQSGVIDQGELLRAGSGSHSGIRSTRSPSFGIGTGQIGAPVAAPQDAVRTQFDDLRSSAACHDEDRVLKTSDKGWRA